MKILVINGPNLNMLGARDKKQYGKFTLDSLEELIQKEYPGHEFSFFQSNIEGELIDKVQTASSEYNGLIINPGGYSHTSVALRDALELCNIPKVEVHISNIATREDFRQKTITASATNGYLSGFKEYGYLAAVMLLEKLAQ